MATRSRRRRGGGDLTVDFSGVETFGRIHEDGDYRFKVIEVTQEPGNNDDYLRWVLEDVEDGGRVYNNTSLSKQSLWNLAAFLTALGVEVPDSELELDLESYADLEVMGSVEMESYEGKKRPRLVDFWPVEEDKKGGKSSRGKKDEDDEKPARGRRRSSAKDEEPEERSSRRGAKDEEEALTQDAINDMGEDELEDLIKENKLDVDLRDFSTLRKMRAAVIDAAEDAGLFAEEEEKPARGGRRGRDKDEGEEAPRSRRGGRSSRDTEEEEAPRSRRRSRR